MRNNGLVFCNKKDLFLISRIIYLIFLSTSVTLSILSLSQLFHGFGNFLSQFWRFRFCAPTLFPEVICPRYDPFNVFSLSHFLALEINFVVCHIKRKKEVLLSSSILFRLKMFPLLFFVVEEEKYGSKSVFVW